MKKINLGRMSYLFIIILLLNQFGYLFGMEGEGQGGAAASSSSSAVEAGAIAEQKQLTPYDFKGVYSPLKDEYKCLSPMLGAVWYSKGIIESMYRCGPDDAVTACVKYWFNLIPGGEFLISKTDTLVLLDIPPVVFGLIAGILFTIKNDATRLKSFMESKDKNASLIKCIQGIITSCPQIDQKRRPRKTIDLIVDVCKECWTEGSQYPDYMPWVLLTAYLYKKDIAKKEETDRKGLREYFKGVVMAMALERDHIKKITDALGPKQVAVPDSEVLVNDFLNFMEPIKNNQIVTLPAAAGSLSKLFKNNEEPDWNAQFTHVDKGRFVRDAHSWSTIDSLCENIEEVALLGLQGDLPSLESGQKAVKEGTADCVETALKNMIRIVLYNPETGRIDKKKFPSRPISGELSNFLGTPHATLEAEHFSFGDIVENQPMIVYANLKVGGTALGVSGGIDGYVHLGENRLPDSATLTAEGNTKKLTVGSRKYVIAPEEARVYEVQPHALNIIILMDKLLKLGLFEGKNLAEEFCKVDFVSTYFIAMLEKLGFENVDAFDIKKLDDVLLTYNPPYNIKLRVGKNEDAVFNLHLGSGHGELNSLVPGKFGSAQQGIVFDQLKNIFSPDDGILYASIANLEREDYYALNVRTQMKVDVPLKLLLFMINMHNLGDGEDVVKCLKKVMELMGQALAIERLTATKQLTEEERSKVEEPLKKLKEDLKQCALRLIDPMRVGDIGKMEKYPQELISFYKDVIDKILEHESEQSKTWSYDSEVISRVSEEAVGAFMSNCDSTVSDVKEDVADLVCSLLSWGDRLESSIKYKKYEVQQKEGKNRVVIQKKCEEISKANLIEKIKIFIMSLNGFEQGFWEDFWINFFASGENLLSRDVRTAMFLGLLDNAREHREQKIAGAIAAARKGIYSMNPEVEKGAIELWGLLFGFSQPQGIQEAIAAVRDAINSWYPKTIKRAFKLFDILFSLNPPQGIQEAIAFANDLASSQSEMRKFAHELWQKLFAMMKKNVEVGSNITEAINVAVAGVTCHDYEVREWALELWEILFNLNPPQGIAAAKVAANSSERAPGLLKKLFTTLTKKSVTDGLNTELIDVAKEGIYSGDSEAQEVAFEFCMSLIEFNKAEIITKVLIAMLPAINAPYWARWFYAKLVFKLEKMVDPNKPEGITKAFTLAQFGMNSKYADVKKIALELYVKLIVYLEKMIDPNKPEVITEAFAIAKFGMDSNDKDVKKRVLELYLRLIALDRSAISTEVLSVANTGMASDNEDTQKIALELYLKLITYKRREAINDAIAAANIGMASDKQDVRKGARELWGKLIWLDSQKIIAEALAAAKIGIDSDNKYIKLEALELYDNLVGHWPRYGVDETLAAASVCITSGDDDVRSRAHKLYLRLIWFGNYEINKGVLTAAKVRIASGDSKVQKEVFLLYRELINLSPPQGITEALAAAKVCIASNDKDIQKEALGLYLALINLSPPQGIIEALAAVKVCMASGNSNVKEEANKLARSLLYKFADIVRGRGEVNEAMAAAAMDAVINFGKIKNTDVQGAVGYVLRVLPAHKLKDMKAEVRERVLDVAKERLEEREYNKLIQ